MLLARSPAFSRFASTHALSFTVFNTFAREQLIWQLSKEMTVNFQMTNCHLLYKQAAGWKKYKIKWRMRYSNTNTNLHLQTCPVRCYCFYASACKYVCMCTPIELKSITCYLLLGLQKQNFREHALALIWQRYRYV